MTGLLLESSDEFHIKEYERLKSLPGFNEIFSEDEIKSCPLTLRFTGDGVILTDGVLSLKGDLSAMKRRVLKEMWRHELLSRAARLKSNESGTELPVCIDATAGLGEDSLILSAAGYKVFMFEKNPVIAELLRDSLRRALDDPEICGLAQRMVLTEGDSIEGIRDFARENGVPGIIYLDPMFPGREKTGKIKKKFQLLQKLESPCTDGEGLLRAAMEAGPSRIIIKRPEKGEALGGRLPDFSYTGGTVRYDCFGKGAVYD